MTAFSEKTSRIAAVAERFAKVNGVSSA